MSAFFDTNVLVYAVSRDLRRGRATELLAAGGVVSVQVLNEFIHVASRKLGLPVAEARSALSDILVDLDRPRPLTVALHEAAYTVAAQGGLAWYDALIVASALEAGCDTLWTEDLQDGRRFGRLAIRNPFT